MQNISEKYMLAALRQAQIAYQKGEVPVGAVIVKENKIIARAHNLREGRKDPSAHAELLAIKKAAKRLGDWRLTDCDLYVTLEPCAMCTGAAVNARIKTIVFGAYDENAGCCVSLYRLCADTRLNHRISVYAGLLQEECAVLLSRFFKERRKS